MPEFRVIVMSERFDESLAFYGALGCTVVHGWDDHGRGRIFRVEGTDGCIEVIEAAAGTAGPPGAGVAVEVADVAAQRARLLAAGLAPSELEDQPWGHRNHHVTDPNGLGITFFQVIAPES
jgi:catechol 2,3-dioxygenase-like lactoylglutathione lyase family enzyme